MSIRRLRQNKQTRKHMYACYHHVYPTGAQVYGGVSNQDIQDGHTCSAGSALLRKLVPGHVDRLVLVGDEGIQVLRQWE